MINGFTILSLPSINWPCCISSEYSVVQPASRAEAMIVESRKENWYLSFSPKAVEKTDESIGASVVASQRTKVFSSQIALGSFSLREHARYVSIITCELINGLCFNNKRALSCLAGSDLSNQYTQMLESRKMLLIQIFALPLFYVAKVNSIVAIKFNHFFVRALGLAFWRLINGKGNYFCFSFQESFRKVYYQIGSRLRMDDCSVYFHKQALIVQR